MFMQHSSTEGFEGKAAGLEEWKADLLLRQELNVSRNLLQDGLKSFKHFCK